MIYDDLPFKHAEKMMCVTFIFLILAAWRLGPCESICAEGNLGAKPSLCNLFF